MTTINHRANASRFYTVDLKTVKLSFDENTRASWIQLFPVGTFDHPVFGDLIFDSKFFADILNNYRNNVRNIEPDIDYDHKAHDSKAAGWVKDVELRGDEGLWGLIEWTPQAYTAIQTGEYRYFSPEFGAWQDPKTKTVYENVLLGGGITNRPFLKELQPINLSEILGGTIQLGESMNEFLQKLAATLGVTLSEDENANTDALLAKLNEFVAAHSDLKTKLSETEAKLDAASGQTKEDRELIELSEKSPAIKKLLEDRKADAARLSELERVNRIGAITTKLSEMVIDGKKIAPAVIAKAAPVIAQLPVALNDGFVGIFETILKTGTVQLGEIGGNPSTDRDRVKLSDQAFAKLDEEIKAMCLSEKIDYGTASRKVAALHPELFESYESQFEGKVD